MTEQATGIKTTGADTYVGTFLASEQADGKTRVIQIISMTAGKIETGTTRSNVSFDDSWDVTTVSGDLIAGDNKYLGCYVEHTQSNGKCLITPLLCDDSGVVIGYLPPKVSDVKVPVEKSGSYLSVCLSWEVMSTGAWKIYPHISGLGEGDVVTVYAYTF